MFGLLVVFGVSGAQAQTAVGGQVTHFTDTSMLKPPSGQKIAIVEWEDLECPACARAFPIVHEAIKHYNIPLVRYDFMIPGHRWSKQAEIDARWMQDTFGMDYATEYRREVFATQYKIASLDDLNKFTQQFLQGHGGKQLPFVMDPKYLKEVQADHDLGMKMGLQATPTIVVVTAKEWIQVKDPMQLYQAIDKAEADLGMKSTASASTGPAAGRDACGTDRYAELLHRRSRGADSTRTATRCSSGGKPRKRATRGCTWRLERGRWWWWVVRPC